MGHVVRWAARDIHDSFGPVRNPEFPLNLSRFLVKYLGPALVAGALGGLAMELVMWLIARAGLAKGDMILALGRLVSKSRDNAYRIGLIIHATASIGFGLCVLCGKKYL